MYKTLVAEIALLLRGAPDVSTEEAEVEASKIVAMTAARDNPDRERALGLARQRVEGIPLAQLLGETEFMGLTLYEEPGVFVVRKETELLGARAAGFLREAAAKSVGEVRFVDVGCGTGNLTCGIGSSVPEARGWSSDINPTSSQLTRRNVERTLLGDRVKVFCGDLFAPFAGEGILGTIDVVVCNPPYIATSRLETDRSHLLLHEPREAFDGGPYGLSMHQRLIKEALEYLRPGGHLLFEFGVGQERQVKILFERSRAYDEIDFAINEVGEARVGIGRKKTI